MAKYNVGINGTNNYGSTDEETSLTFEYLPTKNEVLLEAEKVGLTQVSLVSLERECQIVTFEELNIKELK
jgi:hypothetical protein